MYFPTNQEAVLNTVNDSMFQAVFDLKKDGSKEEGPQI